MSKRNLLMALLLLVLVALNFAIPRPSEPEIVLHAQVIHLLGLGIPNTILATWLTMLALVGISYFATRNMQMVPTGLQSAVEWIVESLYNFSAGITRGMTREIFPVAATLFFFIALSNWMGLLPGFGSVGLLEMQEGRQVLVPFLRSVNTDLNDTIALAVFAVCSIQIFGARFLGIRGYVRRFFNFGKLFTGRDLIQGVADAFVGILELVDQFTKILSFSFRLFGNIFAGEVLLMVISFLLPLLGPMPFMGLELFVGFIQALIFVMLTLVFTLAAVGHGRERSTVKNESGQTLDVPDSSKEGKDQDVS
jgi:F-type H+-transporting ATPase subunit a